MDKGFELMIPRQEQVDEQKNDILFDWGLSLTIFKRLYTIKLNIKKQ